VTTPRKMPSKKQIKEHWTDWLIDQGKFDSKQELFEADYCFSCGMEEKTERCHILARTLGGSDDVQNLHLLCSDCHKASELLSGLEYFQWFEQRNLMLRIFDVASGETILNALKEVGLTS